MKHQDILKSIISGQVTASDIPEIGIGRILIQTGADQFTDSITGERFTDQQAEKMAAPFRDSPFTKCLISVGKNYSFGENDDVHPSARKPFCKETEYNGKMHFMFLKLSIPEVDSESRLFFIESALQSRNEKQNTDLTSDAQTM